MQVRQRRNIISNKFKFSAKSIIFQLSALNSDLAFHFTICTPFINGLANAQLKLSMKYPSQKRNKASKQKVWNSP